MRGDLRFLRVLAPIVVVTILTMLGGLWSCTNPMTPKPPQPTPGGVRFMLQAPGAKHVSLVGSFNGWNKGVMPMKTLDGALWTVIVPLNEGEHMFMYLIDGSEWLTPPQADDFVTDGFGQTNGVVIVR